MRLYPNVHRLSGVGGDDRMAALVQVVCSVVVCAVALVGAGGCDGWQERGVRMRIVVGHLTMPITEDDLRQLFAPYGAGLSTCVETLPRPISMR